MGEPNAAKRASVRRLLAAVAAIGAGAVFAAASCAGRARAPGAEGASKEASVAGEASGAGAAKAAGGEGAAKAAGGEGAAKAAGGEGAAKAAGAPAAGGAATGAALAGEGSAKTLAGEGSAKTPADEGAADAAGPRALGLSYPTWVYPAPARTPGPFGAVRPGTFVALLSPEPRAGKGGCRGGWLAVSPAGFLCNDDHVSLDPAHPLGAAGVGELVAPLREGVLPYRYAFSRRAPVYGRVPTPAEQERVEGPEERRPRARKPTKGGFGGHDELTVDEEIAAEAEVPAALAGGRPLPTPQGPAPLVRKWVPEGSTVAFSRAFRAEGRTWLVSTDFGLVPADRVVSYRTSDFGGVKLGGEARLPRAWARRHARPFYRREAGGWVPTGERLAARASVALTGDRVEAPKGAYWKVEGPGETYLFEGEVAVARLRPPPGGTGPDEKWIDIRLRDGTLVAYEGATPVYATMVSGGAGGAGGPDDTDHDLVLKSATPVGAYRVSWKIGASRMSPEPGEPERFWLAEVPYTLYFRPPFAIHTAYWHEDFGSPKSAGCVNVSPADGKFLFGWVDPPLPKGGWQGVGPGKATGLGTRIVIAP
ncbi:MAG TPA: L,D-transpeptidase [Polyangiaceae bacterium]|nr:L,D-transpeptidase [Polyangiaceae bacterium]